MERTLPDFVQQPAPCKHACGESISCARYGCPWVVTPPTPSVCLCPGQVTIENSFVGTGDVVVSRTETVGAAGRGAYTWRVTFLDLYGVVPQITADSALTGTACCC